MPCLSTVVQTQCTYGSWLAGRRHRGEHGKGAMRHIQTIKTDKHGNTMKRKRRQAILRETPFEVYKATFEVVFFFFYSKKKPCLLKSTNDASATQDSLGYPIKWHSVSLCVFFSVQIGRGEGNILRHRSLDIIETPPAKSTKQELPGLSVTAWL